jgi:hypothetical protein
MTRSLISEAERQAWGDEVLSVMERKAQEAVGPALNELNRQNQQLRGELQQVKAHDIYSTLDQSLPNWREINQSQNWRDWLAVPDIYSGTSKQQLLNQAFASGDAGRVLMFLRGYLAENSRGSAPNARAPRMSADNSQAVITNKQIEDFYDRVRRGLYEGKDKQKMAEEAQIHRAILEGRLRRT